MLSLMSWQSMLTIKALKLNTEFECPTTYVFCSDYTYMCDSLNESLCVLELLVLVWKYDILVLANQANYEYLADLSTISVNILLCT